jgi:uncharacterized LabA/DUF88 family protein
MALLARRVRSALLLDFDNIDGQVGKSFGTNIEAWLAWLEDGAFAKTRRARNFVVKKAYWNGRTDKKRDTFEQHGFEAFACRSQAANKIKENKSSADIVITIDAMDAVHEERGLKEVILLTADTDFVPLVNRLQQKGLHVVVVGNEGDPSSAIFRERGAEVISVGALRDACGYVSPNRRKPRATSPRASSALLAVSSAATEEIPSAGSAKNAPAAKPQRAKPKQQATFDLDQAAKVIADVCMQTPNRAASRAAIERALTQVVGFTKVPTKQLAAWLGCKNLDNLLKELATRAPGLDVSKSPSGNYWQIKFVGDVPNPPAQSESP